MRQYRSKSTMVMMKHLSSFLLFLFLSAGASLLLKFENVADFKFFVGIGLPWEIWKVAFLSLKLGKHNKRGCEVRPCSDLNLVFSSQIPTHMDHFLSFCLKEQKTWNRIDPLHHDNFDSVWSGNAQIMLREKKATHRIIVQQNKGDIIFVPPWWIHETQVGTLKKNLGFNIHFGVRGQITMELMDMANLILGDPSLVYSLVTPAS
jgi:hypothetical protein